MGGGGEEGEVGAVVGAGPVGNVVAREAGFKLAQAINTRKGNKRRRLRILACRSFQEGFEKLG
jgi:hypothetical protein